MKTAIFDYSGVINDNREITYYTTSKVLEHYGAPAIAFEEFRQEWVQPYMLFYNKYLPQLTLKEERENYRIFYQEVLAQHPLKLYPGIREFLRKVKDQGVNLMIISSDDKRNLAREIKIFGLEGLFTEIIAGMHDKTESLFKLIADYNLDVQQTIFIGDTVHEIEVGKKAGILTGAVTWGIDNEEKLRVAQPDYLIHNLEELKIILLN